MIGREDIGLEAALPRVASHAPILQRRALRRTRQN